MGHSVRGDAAAAAAHGRGRRVPDAGCLWLGARCWVESGTPVARATGRSVPAWRMDGFERVDLDRLSLLQVCRTDSPRVRFHCKTTVFRRLPSVRASSDDEL